MDAVLSAAKFRKASPVKMKRNSHVVVAILNHNYLFFGKSDLIRVECAWTGDYHKLLLNLPF
jgi:hypothetical protein